MNNQEAMKNILKYMKSYETLSDSTHALLSGILEDEQMTGEMFTFVHMCQAFITSAEMQSREQVDKIRKFYPMSERVRICKGEKSYDA